MVKTKKAVEAATLQPENIPLDRIVKEGYGPGSWHGPDLQSALADIESTLAFWRPAAGRHNIAEIALHHAWYVRSVVEQLRGRPAEPFPLPCTDWFEMSAEEPITWREITELVDRYHEQLATLVREPAPDRSPSPIPPSERLDMVLGITCHAVYDAGQVQLLKALARKTA
jgi:hypothetical protein